jgi:hypothetical protein
MKALALLAAAAAIRAQAAPAVLQHGYDANVSGANLAETALNTSNVGPNTFGHLFNLKVDDKVFAQPLYVPGVAIPGLGKHNVVYVATMRDSVYAFDADAGGAPLWSTNLASLFSTTAVPWADFTMNGGVEGGNLGILSTPVIDSSTNILYVVACTLEGGTMAYRLHALDIATGTEPYGPGVLITASYAGVTFDAAHQTQRVSLALAGNQVVFGFGSMETEAAGTYGGWVLAYNKLTLQQSGAFATVTVGKGGGGVWQSGRPAAVDSANNAYVFVGNAWGDGYDGVHNFSESVLKLDPSDGLTLVDWFTPGDWNTLDINDQDLTSSGPLLIPGTALLAGGGKTGYLYVLNTADLGKYNATDSQVVQKELISAGEIHGGPVYWNRSAADGGPLMYNWGAADVVKTYPFSGSTFAAGPSAMSTANAVMPGGMLALSANGGTAGSGVLWATTNSLNPLTGILHAFDAGNVSNELWNSMMSPTRDGYGIYSKFVPPLVVNGKVYVATFSTRVAVYGLGVAPPAFTLSPTSLVFGNVQTTTSSAAQSVTVTNKNSTALPITNITFTGATASQFSQTNNCGASVAVGSTCTISVVFTPAAVGSQTVWLNLNAGDGAGTKTTELFGAGVAPFTVSPSKLKFGDEQANVASAPQSATVTNGGTAALPIAGISFTGPNASSYSQTNTCGASVPQGSTCTIQVTFTPKSAGYGWATLNVNGGPGSTQSASVNGTGTVPFTTSPSSLAFGKVQTGSASAAQKVTVTNAGSVALPINAVTLSGANSSAFSQTNTCGAPVAVGSTCTISVVFSPTATGSQAASLTVGAPGATHGTGLSGTGVLP